MTNYLKSISLLSKWKCLLFFSLFFSPGIYGQPGELISGRVISSANNLPLDGVSITISGTQKGAITNKDGLYQINASPDNLLIFSFLGYEPQTIKVGSSRLINVSLNVTNQSLGEVVVVGYGAQKKSDLTGSIGIVDMSAVENLPMTSVNQALDAQIPGVQISTTNGVPGGGPSVQIRGITAIGAGASPLYVVDGYALPNSSANTMQVFNPLNSIPTSDILSVSVLKGPSATAIYGSRASNGVIIIETKAGKAGKVKFNVNAYTGFQKILNSQEPKMLNAREFAQFEKDFVELNNEALGLNVPVPAEYQNPEQYGEGTTWFNEVTRTAPISNVSFSASGGNENFRSYLSGSYFNQQGVVLGSDYNRFTLRANLDANITKRLHMGVRISPTFSFSNGNQSSEGSNERNDFFGSFMVLNPIESVFNPDGTYNTFITGPLMLGMANPVFALKTITDKKNTNNLLSTVFFDYEVIDGLHLRTNFDANLNNDVRRTFFPSTVANGFNAPPRIPSGGYSQSEFWNWASENSIVYDHTFNGDHHINVLGNFSVQQQKMNSTSLSGTQFPDDDIQTLNQAALLTGGTDLSNWSMVSYLGRLNYSYKDKYLVTGTIRRDGSSKFGPDNRWGTFPSVAAAWRVINEPWMNRGDNNKISDLKIRVEYGVTGNDQIGTYPYAAQISQSNYILNNALAGGKSMVSMGNPSLTWEQTNEFGAGFDLGLFSGRINIVGDFYRTITKNLLLNINLPRVSGYGSSIQNMGRVRNYGFELGINSKNISTRNFTWNMNLNFSMNRNKVLELGPDGQPIKANAGWGDIYGTSITEVGKAMGLFYGWKWLGLYTSKEDVDNSPHYADAVPGALKVADVSGNGIIQPYEDFTIIGSPYPDFTFGFSNMITYKRFDLNIITAGSIGGQRFHASYGSQHNTDGVFNVTKDQLNRYTSPDKPGNGKVPTLVGVQNRLMYRSMGGWSLQNSSYFWIKNINLAYNFSFNSDRNQLITGLQLYLSVQNAFIFTPYDGNPAATDYVRGSNLTPGVDWNPYPVSRITTLGVNLSF